MATAEQMAAYAASLSHYLPAQDKPVTEVVIFRLKDSQSAATLTDFEQEIILNTRSGAGVKRQAYGFSLTDSKTFIWMLDWEKIQDHWDFWQTPAFPPVIACIKRLFEEGRPLVRHYDFAPMGMLLQELQRVIVWQSETVDLSTHVLRGTSRAIANKAGNAVDMQETAWRCILMGYKCDQDADSEGFVDQEHVEAHLVRLKFVSKAG